MRPLYPIRDWCATRFTRPQFSLRLLLLLIALFAVILGWRRAIHEAEYIPEENRAESELFILENELYEVRRPDPELERRADDLRRKLEELRRKDSSHSCP